MIGFLLTITIHKIKMIALKTNWN